MALRLIQVRVNLDQRDQLRQISQDLGLRELFSWTDEPQGQAMCQWLAHSEQVQGTLDKLSELEQLHIIVSSVEAALPELAPSPQAADKDESSPLKIGRLSREELQLRIEDSLALDRPTLAMIVLSTIVAIVGLIRADTAVIVGAMVIAPLLSPNVALSFGTTLGDLSLIRRALKLAVLYLIIAMVISAVVGALLPGPLESEAIRARTRVGLPDLALAMAAGSAGVFAMTRGLSEAVIGVMVAAALLPPLVAAALLLGQLDLTGAVGALGLVSANVICINLAGVATFWAQGLKPKAWWDKARAKRAMLIATGVWLALLAGLVGLILFFGPL